MQNALRDTPAVQRLPPSPPPPSDEIDLLAYAAVCWRYRYVLLAATLLAGAVTYAVNRQIAPTYEVGFRLMATEPRLGNEPQREMSVVVYRELVESASQAAALLSEFGLDRPPHNLTPRRFLEDHVDVEVIRDSTIIRVAVRLKDRDLLVKLAQRYAERVVEMAQRLNTEGSDYTAQRIKLERDAALERLAISERAVKDFRQTAQIEVLQRDVDTMLERRPEALDLTVRIQGERARVQQAEAELANQQRVRTERRTVDALPARPEDEPRPPAQTRTEPGRPATPSGQAPRPHAGAAEPVVRGSGSASKPQPPRTEELNIRSEFLDPYVNPVYEALARDAADARSRLASLERQRSELVSRLKLDAPAAEKLTRLYELESALARLTREQDVARSAYLNAANKYEDARLQTSARSPRLSILDAALPPDRPVAPRSVRNTLAAMLVALTLAVVAVIALDAARARRAGRA